MGAIPVLEEMWVTSGLNPYKFLRMVEVCVVEESCSTECCSVRWLPLLFSQALHKYTFSLDFMNHGIGNVFSGMLVNFLSKYVFRCTQVAGKLDIMP